MINGKTHQKKLPANFVGPQIRRWRTARGWSQATLATKIQISGLDIGREVLAQIETQTHCLRDKDVPYFAHALKVDLAELYFGNEQGRLSITAVIALLQTICPQKPLPKSCNDTITTPMKQSW